MADALDLAAELDARPLVDGRTLAFVAGSAPGTAAAVDALVAALGRLGEGPWWSVREWTDRVRLAEGLAGAEEDAERLVWARWFSRAGDLELWRVAERFRWRFLGEPPGIAGWEEDFFATREGAPPAALRDGGEETGLLWDPEDARVATADAETLALLREGPLALRYTAYYDHGVVAAVRYRGLEPVSHEQEGSAT